MATATMQSLSNSEREMLAETDSNNLRLLDEDALIALHDRVRRARTKHVQLHRREVGQQVTSSRARGVASVPPRRSRSKAEIFEDALARVSTALAKRARQSSAELRAARLAAASQSKGGGKPARRATSDSAVGTTPAKPNSRSRQPSPAERKSVASTRAMGAKRQAKSDAR